MTAMMTMIVLMRLMIMVSLLVMTTVTVTLLREPVMTVTLMTVAHDYNDDASDHSLAEYAHHDDDHDCTTC